MEERLCYYCDEPATHHCPTCSRLYCDEHGAESCLRCEAPEAAMPNVWAYRGSLLALVAGVTVVVYLLVSPPATQEVATARPAATPTATATARPTSTPVSLPSTPAVETPTALPTAAPAASPTTTPFPAQRTYTIQLNDTLFDIAAAFDTTVDEIMELNPGLEPTALNPGDMIILPGAP